MNGQPIVARSSSQAQAHSGALSTQPHAMPIAVPIVSPSSASRVTPTPCHRASGVIARAVPCRVDWIAGPRAASTERRLRVRAIG